MRKEVTSVRLIVILNLYYLFAAQHFNAVMLLLEYIYIYIYNLPYICGVIYAQLILRKLNSHSQSNNEPGVVSCEKQSSRVSQQQRIISSLVSHIVFSTQYTSLITAKKS